MEIMKPIKIPVIADSVLSPDLLYDGERGTSILFITNTSKNLEDDKHGRITFENLDAVKICRGECYPYELDWSTKERGIWVFQVENSQWQKERYEYEKKHYGSSYEWGGDVNEMLTDFKHYLFSFHDQFIEAIARGFWFEEAEQSLFKKELTAGHPFLQLPADNHETITVQSIKCQIWKNPKPKEQLAHDAQFCSQKLYEFALMLEDDSRPLRAENTLVLAYRNGKLISILTGYFSRQEAVFDGIASLEQVKPLVEKYMAEVHERRQNKNGK